MSCLPLKKKHLLPSSNVKAWRSFTSRLRCKLQKLKKSESVKKATTHLDTFYQNQHETEFHAGKLRHQRSFTPVYVDELFQQPEQTVAEHEEPKIQAQKAVQRNEAAASYGSVVVNGELGDVDARAEMFIAKFREELRLQRQRSLEKYQEMLARGL